MTNQELFSQAIADAKAVRDTAVANAKAALEETFTPKIMSMLSTKLNELEEELEEKKEVEEEAYDKEMKDEGHETTIGFGAASKKPQIEGDEEKKEESYEEGASLEEMDLEEILAQLEAEEKGKQEEGKKEVEEGKDEVEEGKKEVEEAKKKDDDKKKVEESLEEAISTIKTLQAELNEVNLLNAKLLYTNKIFKAKSLNEAQKVKVLKAFDKATNVKEVKTVYTTLSESLTTKTRSTIKESVGFASKAAGIAPAQPIVEGDAAIRRMQQLAGIIK